MLANKKVGFVGGGNMAESLVKGLTASSLIEAENIFVSDPIPERLEYLRNNFKNMGKNTKKKPQTRAIYTCIPAGFRYASYLNPKIGTGKFFKITNTRGSYMYQYWQEKRLIMPAIIPNTASIDKMMPRVHFSQIVINFVEISYSIFNPNLSVKETHIIVLYL